MNHRGIFGNFCSTALAISLIACGGGGSSGGGGSKINNPDPFDIGSYSEYTAGDDLSGIWMMVVNADYDYETESGQTKKGSTSARTTLFIQEFSGTTSGLGISNPFCASPIVDRTNYDISGSKITLSTAGALFDLSVESNSRISGQAVEQNYIQQGCYGDGLGDICLTKSNITNIDSTVELVKVAPLPGPNGNYYFGAARPSIGNITGHILSPGGIMGSSLAIDFAPITCLAQIITNGGALLSWSPYSNAEGNYEQIIVNHSDSASFYAEKIQDEIQVENVSFLDYSPIFDGSFYTNNFASATLSTHGANPSTVTIEIDSSSDASSDASGDRSTIEVNLDI